MRGGARAAVLAALLMGCGSSSAVLDAGQADAAQPDAAQPDAAQPDAAQPDAAQPDAAQPDAPPPAALTLTSPFDDFGGVPVGITSLPITVTATNTGGTPSNALTTSIVAVPMQFSISNDTCTGLGLGPGASCTFVVRFMPTHLGGASASVRVDDGVVSATRMIYGTATTNDDRNIVTPVFLDLGSTVVGTTVTSPTTITVFNVGAVTHGAITTVLGGPDPAAFGVLANGCEGTALPPFGSCTFQVSFTPHASGVATAVVDLIANPGGQATMTLRGTGLDPDLRVDLAARNFGAVSVGDRSEYARFEVTNIGTASVGPLSTMVSGLHSGDFTISSTANTCAAATLAPNATCSVEVRFEPLAEQQRYARLVVGDGTRMTVTDLTGQGNSGTAYTITPTPFSFGDVTVGQTSAPKRFTITNLGTSLPFTSLVGATSVFQISNDTCSNMSPAIGASCTFDVTAHPTAAGFVAAEIGTGAYTGLLVRGVP